MIARPPDEKSLGQVVDERVGPNEISLGRVVVERLGPVERARLANEVSITALRVVFTLGLLALFGWLNYQVMNLVTDVFVATNKLDKEIIMALVGGTVTQVGLITYLMASFLFPSGK